MRINVCSKPDLIITSCITRNMLVMQPPGE